MREGLKCSLEQIECQQKQKSYKMDRLADKQQSDLQVALRFVVRRQHGLSTANKFNHLSISVCVKRLKFLSMDEKDDAAAMTIVLRTFMFRQTKNKCVSSDMFKNIRVC